MVDSCCTHALRHLKSDRNDLIDLHLMMPHDGISGNEGSGLMATSGLSTNGRHFNGTNDLHIYLWRGYVPCGNNPCSHPHTRQGLNGKYGPVPVTGPHPPQPLPAPPRSDHRLSRPFSLCAWIRGQWSAVPCMQLQDDASSCFKPVSVVKQHYFIEQLSSTLRTALFSHCSVSGKS